MKDKKYRAAVAQLVEHDLAKVGVTSSSLVSRSNFVVFVKTSVECQSLLKKYLLVARVVELVDTRDLKSLAGNSVPVQVRPRVPFF